jgi:hypothetical protein
LLLLGLFYFFPSNSILPEASNVLLRGDTSSLSLSSLTNTISKTLLTTSSAPTYKSTNDEHCRFYLSESAIPQSGLGIFTSVSLQEGDMAQPFSDICIYVADTPKGRSTHFHTHSWSRDTWLGTFEGVNPRAACEGVATLFNSMPPGVQTSKLHLLSPQNNAGIVRSKHANAGAITHYAGISSIATRAVDAGSEITIDYGEYVI